MTRTNALESRVCATIKPSFARWAEQSVIDLTLPYLLLAGPFSKMHDGARAEPVLAAWGCTTQGTSVLVVLAPVGSWSTEAWLELVPFVPARIREFADTYGSRYPAAVMCLTTNRVHHRRIRHSNGTGQLQDLRRALLEPPTRLRRGQRPSPRYSTVSEPSPNLPTSANPHGHTRTGRRRR